MAMTQAKPRFSTFEEYLSYDDGTDKLYELFNGELIELPPESGENNGILSFVHFQLVLLMGHLRVRWGLELEVRGEPKNRYPDLTIIREEHIQQLQLRNTIRLSMEPPLLVIEAVSPGESNRHRDYIDKRKQYQDRGIPEYWLIDPAQPKVRSTTQRFLSKTKPEGAIRSQHHLYNPTANIHHPPQEGCPVKAAIDPDCRQP